MRSEWNLYKIGELCDTISDTYNRSDDMVILINTSDVLAGKIINHNLVSNKNLKGQFKKTFRKNDILYSEIRPINKRFAFIDFEDTEKYIASTKLMVLRSHKDIILPYFLFTLLQLQDMINKLQHLAETRSGTFPQITFLGELAPIEVKIPDLNTQSKIVSILMSIDTKISLNNAINKNLEEQAQAIFKSWFVDFEPFGGVMPDDWRTVKIADLEMLITDYVANGSFASLKENVTLYQEPNYAYFIRNTDLKSGSFGVFVDESSYKFLSKSTLYGNEIIISNVGDVGSVFLCPRLDKPMTLGNNIIMLRPKSEYLIYYLYIWFKWGQGQCYIQGIKGGSAQPKFNKTDFKNLPLLFPSFNVLSRFDEVMKSLFETISNNYSENQRLASIRDTLLPKLMNGEIDISAVKV